MDQTADDTVDRLAAAVRCDDVACLRAFAAAHGSGLLRGRDDPGAWTILHHAAGAGSLGVVRFLASDAVGADINAARVNNFTPLHSAAMNGHEAVCALLVELGARLDVQTAPQGYAPLHSAAWGGHAGVVNLLLREGARTDLVNYRGETPAQTARRQRHPEVAACIDAAIK